MYTKCHSGYIYCTQNTLVTKVYTSPFTLISLTSGYRVYLGNLSSKTYLGTLSLDPLPPKCDVG